MKIPLEDNCEDIVGKAMRGLGVSEGALVEQSGVDLEALRRLLDGRAEAETARKVAPVLGLDPEKLAVAASKGWYPETRAMAGLAMSNTPYHDMMVNAYLIWDAQAREGAFFDTGSDAAELLERAQGLGLTMGSIFLTHAHRDHIMDLKRVRDAYPEATVYLGEREDFEGCQPVRPGDRFSVGGLSLEARLTWGHSPGGITYVIKGLEVPVAVVGDSLFAGSMGGGMVSYEDALRCNREEILSLPAETILCPGHGPLTTVGEELEHNPFF